tara:strand:+ start:476 stop:826 length:351 start_codon:yes stop_codon:yes gene_type:complete
MRTRLERLLDCEGYEVHQAENGVEALKLLGEDSKINMVLSGLDLSDSDAMTFLKNARQNDKTKYLPVLIHYDIAQCSRDIKEFIKGLGVTAFIPRPVKAKVLVSLLEKVVERQVVA